MCASGSHLPLCPVMQGNGLTLFFAEGGMKAWMRIWVQKCEACNGKTLQWILLFLSFTDAVFSYILSNLGGWCRSLWFRWSKCGCWQARKSLKSWHFEYCQVLKRVMCLQNKNPKGSDFPPHPPVDFPLYFVILHCKSCEFGDSVGAGAISETENSIFLWGEPMPEKVSILLFAM